MVISIDVLALILLLLIIISYTVRLIVMKIMNNLAEKKHRLDYVYCRFCRQESQLSEAAVAEANKNKGSKIARKTAKCTNCGRRQWRGSSRNLL